MSFTYDKNGNDKGEEELSTLFYDHVVNGDTKQGMGVVTPLLEAAVMILRIDLPSVEEVVLLSDNAGCYQNSSLPMTAP